MRHQTTGGLGFCSVLVLIFIVLKLTGAITWSWWWVLAPAWLPIAFVVVIAGMCILIVKIMEGLKR